MELKSVVKSLLTTVLDEFSYHPFIAPYINTLKDNPPKHFIHQCEVIARLVFRRPIRVLIGDEIGLGKTITALAVVKYLEKLGRVSRVLIIVPRVLVRQWRRELLRMGISEIKIKHLERYTLEFLKSQNFPEGYYIASMDLLKREERISEVVDVPWDLIIIDEVHKLGYKTERFWRLGKRLVEAAPGRNVLFLSATPHRGDPRDYISRLQLLDPYLTESWKGLDRRYFYEVTHGSLLFRRTKEDVNKVYEEKEVFPPAKFYAGVIKARKDEVEFVGKLVEFLRSKLVEFAYERGLISEKVIPLLTVLIFKRATSSPYAAMVTLERLLIRRAAPELTDELVDEIKSFLETGYEDYEYLERDPEEIFNDFLDATSPLLSERDKREIMKLRDMARMIIEKGDSKLNALISLLEDVMGEENSKVIVFTEYKDTLNYIVEKLNQVHPEWSRNILRLSSDETRDDRKFQRIREAFERDPRARILIATDVIAEGVNLQVAHILINYEVPWSLVKLEQRIGRVWRLGQKKEVEAYTLFMANVADQAALNSMYRKLLSLKRAKLSPRPVTGQEVLLYADVEDLVKFPVSVAVTKKKGKKRFLKVTEAKSILTYLREDRVGLEKLIASIIAARQEIERELASKGVLYKPRSRKDVERTISLLGFRDPRDLMEALKNLVKASSCIMGFEVFEEDGSLKVVRGAEMPVSINTLDDIYGLLARDKSSRCPVGSFGLVAYGDVEGKIILVPVQVKDRKDGTVLYRELVGMDVNHNKILRGSELLNTVSRALIKCMGVVESYKSDLRVPFNMLPSIMEKVRKSALALLEPVNLYVNRLVHFALRDLDRTWIRSNDLEVTFLDPICYIRFVKTLKTPIKEPLEEIRKEVEEKAVEVVMEVERAEGRIPVRVSEEEHYDIKSVDPLSKKVRIIEVKGHYGSEIYGELTDAEAKLAEKEGERYWLYIVYDIGSGEPKWVRFRDPLRTMNWKIFEKVEKKRRYLLWPKDLVEGVDVG